MSYRTVTQMSHQTMTKMPQPYYDKRVLPLLRQTWHTKLWQKCHIPTTATNAISLLGRSVTPNYDKNVICLLWQKSPTPIIMTKMSYQTLTKMASPFYDKKVIPNHDTHFISLLRPKMQYRTMTNKPHRTMTKMPYPYYDENVIPLLWPKTSYQNYSTNVISLLWQKCHASTKTKMSYQTMTKMPHPYYEKIRRLLRQKGHTGLWRKRHTPPRWKNVIPNYGKKIVCLLRQTSHTELWQKCYSKLLPHSKPP